MPLCIMDTQALDEIHEWKPAELTLDRESVEDYYESDMAWGEFIPVFLSFLVTIIRESLGTEFTFVESDYFDSSTFEEITNPWMRHLVTLFTNEHYEHWRDNDLEIMDYGETSANCRDDFCRDCESGWEEIHGEYDGPLAEDVEDNENAVEPGISELERSNRRMANEERRRERERRRHAQNEAEERIVERNRICETDCDELYGHVRDRVTEYSTYNTPMLHVYWRDFMKKHLKPFFPELKFSRFKLKLQEVASHESEGAVQGPPR